VRIKDVDVRYVYICGVVRANQRHLSYRARHRFVRPQGHDVPPPPERGRALGRVGPREDDARLAERLGVVIDLAGVAALVVEHVAVRELDVSVEDLRGRGGRGPPARERGRAREPRRQVLDEPRRALLRDRGQDMRPAVVRQLPERGLRVVRVVGRVACEGH
jgi:hypothetical protein